MDIYDIPLLDLDLSDLPSIEEGLAIIMADDSPMPLSPSPTASKTLYSEKISIRIPRLVLSVLKVRAETSGIGYQTLINQIMAEYITTVDSNGVGRVDR